MATQSLIKNHLEEMISYQRFIALTVSDLQSAEKYYTRIFDMELIGREAELKDGLWYTLPFDKGWVEAEAAGIDLGMVALRKGNFVLVLFQGSVAPGQVYAIGLGLPAEEIGKLRAGLTEESVIEEESSDFISFRDPWQINWQVSVQGVEFRTAGDFADRWLKLE